MKLNYVETSPATNVLVDLADMKLSGNPGGRISTLYLGSCVAVSIYDPAIKVGGILHFLLPDSRIDQERSMQNPYLFADTGIPMLFHGAYKLGALKERIVCKLAGGAEIFSAESGFRLGFLNHLAASRILRHNGIEPVSEHIGGTYTTAINLNLETGTTLVTLANGETLEI